MARIFLCHASEDKPQVRDVYQRLKALGFEPWLDEVDILPGQDWDYEIETALDALSTALQKMDIHNKLLFLGRLCKSLVIKQKSCHHASFDEIALLRPISPVYRVLHPQEFIGENRVIFS